MFNAFLHQSFLGNDLISITWFVTIILIGFLLQKFFSKLLSGMLFKFFRKFSSGVDPVHFFNLLTKPLRYLILLLTFYLAFDRLSFPHHWHLAPVEQVGLRMLIFRSFQIGIVLSVTWILLRIVDFFALVLFHRASLTESKVDDQLVPFVKEAAKIIICIFSIFFVLGAIFNLNIASLIAGLGIGGLAIALAAKETLENLLGSFTIFFDRPFVVGDFIKSGNIMGTVEKIGFRSTRIRTLEKSFLTVPNKKLVDVELDNLSLRTHRRVAFTIGLLYSTTPEQLKKIIQEIQDLILNHQLTTNDGQVRFAEFGENALNVTIVYYITETLEPVFLQTKEEINYRIMEIVYSNNSSFAFPTRTVFINQ